MSDRTGPPRIATDLSFEEGGRPQAFVSLSREYEMHAFCMVLKERGFEVHQQLDQSQPHIRISLAIIDDLTSLAEAVSYFQKGQTRPEVYFLADANDDATFSRAEAIGATHALVR